MVEIDKSLSIENQTGIGTNGNHPEVQAYGVNLPVPESIQRLLQQIHTAPPNPIKPKGMRGSHSDRFNS